ncbi:MAG: isoaspartyl peptidase/L-asparaginase [Acidobacteriota bacterium]
MSLRSLLPALLTILLVLATASCGSSEPEPENTGDEATSEALPEPPPRERLAWALALHGGAGVIERDEADAETYYGALETALVEGRRILEEGGAALAAVEAVVRLLEDDAKFNAGRGAVFTSKGTHELDAAIMDGRTLAAGAVTGVRNVRNPITLARRVMERSPHVLLAGEGADEYSKEVDVRRAPQDYFTTQRRYRQWQEAWRAERRGQSTSSGFGTVGAVALDRYGNLAAATSTGGMTNKRFGRVGDVPIVGAGTYANNETAAISATGRGEEFIRHVVAHDISSRMAYGSQDLQQAATAVIDGVLQAGDGGVVAVDAYGAIAMPFNSKGMFRGAADSDGRFEVGIWEELVDRSAGN